MDILEAAKKLTGVNWNLRGDILEQADDGSPRAAFPDPKAIQDLIDGEAYIDKRRKEYPSIGDQLDAIWEGGQATIDMKTQIDAVKAKYPKG